MPNKEVLEAMNRQDGIAFMILGAFIWHLAFSAILALAKWTPTKADRYSATSKREPWEKHDRIAYYRNGIPYNPERIPPPPPKPSGPQQHQQIQPPPQPPTEFSRHGW
ncbi:hypothetical protein [Siphonobacter sp. SORGH_AS_0500]|uniref:hypothetical protein n=1 Tax=Siphonobacter sp. SORGH_AS_0500 TaxID=1864824 RepID=UPI0028645D57|nr:hypothetical protein [Siphonobacter sp. SORGH_AS_0500]MDR6195172.1 hypothetical protein [Siphonobacter sp. SORGH_AS_0500]